jgi:hypothetical protein
LIGPLGKWIRHFTTRNRRWPTGRQAEQLVGGYRRQPVLDVLWDRRLEVTGHARDHHACATGLDDIAEHFQRQRDAHKVHCQNDFW